jgi:O-antigen/teichoic acid export membrane protein
VLLSVGEQRRTVRYNTVALISSVPLHLPLIHWWGPSGAALGSVLIGLVTAAWALHLVRRVAHAALDRGRLARVLGANAILAAVAGAGYAGGLAPWLAAALAVSAYLPALVALRAVPRDLTTLLDPDPVVVP